MYIVKVFDHESWAEERILSKIERGSWKHDRACAVGIVNKSEGTCGSPLRNLIFVSAAVIHSIIERMKCIILAMKLTLRSWKMSWGYRVCWTRWNGKEKQGALETTQSSNHLLAQEIVALPLLNYEAGLPCLPFSLICLCRQRCNKDDSRKEKDFDSNRQASMQCDHPYKQNSARLCIRSVDNRPQIPD